MAGEQPQYGGVGQQPQSGGVGQQPQQQPGSTIPAVQPPTPSQRQGWQAQGVQFAGARGSAGGQAGFAGGQAAPTHLGGGRFGSGQQLGGQPGPTQFGTAATTGQAPTVFEDSLSNTQRWALYDLHKVAQQGRWCAGQCLAEGPQMAGTARLVGDLADLAELNERLISRQSPHAPTMVQAFVQAAQSATQQLAGHHEGHVQGTVRTVQRAIDSVGRALQETGPQAQPGAMMQPGRTMQQWAAGPHGAGQQWAAEAPQTGLGAPTLPLPP